MDMTNVTLLDVLLVTGDCKVYYEKDDLTFVKLYKNTDEYIIIKNKNKVIYDFSEPIGILITDVWEFITKKLLSYTFTKEQVDKIINKIKPQKFSLSTFKKNLKNEAWGQMEVLNHGGFFTIDVYEKQINGSQDCSWLRKNKDKKLFTMNINKQELINNGKYGMTISFYDDIHEDSIEIFNIIDSYIKNYFRNYKFVL